MTPYEPLIKPFENVTNSEGFGFLAEHIGNLIEPISMNLVYTISAAFIVGCGGLLVLRYYNARSKSNSPTYR